MTQERHIEGEGSYTGARQYDEATKAFIASGQMEEKARQAANMSEEEQAESARAEKIAKTRAREEDPALRQNGKFLVAIDASEASEKAVTYVAEALQGHQNVQVILLHVPGPIAPKILEHGGSESSQEERQKEERLDNMQREWLQEAEKNARPIFTKARTILHAAHIPEHAIKTQICPSLPGQDITAAILEAADSNACGTVVVGQSSFSWLQKLFQQHVADKLVEANRDFTVWVVGDNTEKPTAV